MNPVSRLVSKVFAPWRQKSLRLIGESGGWLRIDDGPVMGGWQQDLRPASQDSVMRYQAVFACMTLIAQDIGKLRPKLVEQQPSGIWKETQSAAFSPVLRKPNHYQNRIKFFEYWIACKLSRGNAYALKQRDNRGVVQALHLLDPWRVTPLVSDVDGAVFYQLDNDLLADLPDQITVPASEIIHDPMVTLFHPLCGVSPIYACCMAAQHGLKIQGNSIKFFDNMSRPSGILIAPGSIKDEDAAKLKKRWDEGFTGLNQGKVAILGDGLKYEAMGVTAMDAQLIEQLKWTAEMVCSVFHVPAYMAGMAAPPAVDNIEALTQQYFGQCLQSLIESLELSLVEGLGIDTADSKMQLGVKLDLKGLLRMDTASRYKANTEGVTGGWLKPNEARADEDLDPVAGGDTPYLQVQNYSLAALGKRDSAPQAMHPSLQPPAPAPAEPTKPDDAPTDDAAKSLDFLLGLADKDIVADYVARKIQEIVITSRAREAVHG